MEPIIGTIAFLAFILTLCEIIGQRIIVPNAPSAYRIYLIEFIATMQVCMCKLECELIPAYYGISGLVFALTGVFLLARYTSRGAFCNPAGVISKSIHSKVPIMNAAIFVGIHFASAWFAFQAASLFWHLHLHTMHEKRDATAYPCSSADQVTIVTALCCGALAGLADIFGAQINKRVNANVSPIIASFVGAVMVVMGLRATGMSLNPILATVSTFGCAFEPNRGAHTMAYWTGPVIGLTVSHMIKERL